VIRVGVNGYGVIGRRVASAVRLQEDMELVGVAKKTPDYKARLAAQRGIRVYAADGESVERFSRVGLEVAGLLEDLIRSVDIVVDATPEEVGVKNKPLYVKASKKAVFQGGEAPDVADASFVAQCNFLEAAGKQSLRVVSCNTTALCRILHSLDQAYGVRRARVVLARRAADPEETKKGPIDSVVLDPVEIPSHHAEDVRTVLPNINITTMALKVPTTHMHLHSLIISLKSHASASSVRDTLEQTPRIVMVSAADGFRSTSHLVDFAREMGRPRNDLYENIVWQDSIRAEDGEVCFFMAVHQEAIVVPENIDAIRALSGRFTAGESMLRTNRSLGILK